jgi:hypothetical protein
LEDEEIINKESGVKGYAYCTRLGHRIGDCPKQEHQKSMAITGSRKIITTVGAGGWRRKHHFGSIIYKIVLHKIFLHVLLLLPYDLYTLWSIKCLPPISTSK